MSISRSIWSADAGLRLPVDSISRTSADGCPDAKKYIGQLVNDIPTSQLDLYRISLDDIIEFLDAVGDGWTLARGIRGQLPDLEPVTERVLEATYRNCTAVLSRDRVRERVKTQIGSRYLEGWVPTKLSYGRVLQIRAVDARRVHIIAGNVPIV